ncbi:hypothetical protein GCM10009117_17010 [Gangjinia marincola]|uniref:ATP synthase F1 complex delta/epsilon subunit N-terminal domain-containing protein n=1 Tax=Gangjinia marincola TaxID=578463 RepID=A0ABN1MH97_9FLAO
MYLEIVSPERVLLSAEITSVTVPGVDGEFQLLNNHAPIISLLNEGTVKVSGNITLTEENEALFTKKGDQLMHDIKGGVIELKDNKIIILAD